MANDYAINYDDERFKAVENEKQERLNEVNETYNNMVSQSDKFYQDQINAAKDYATTQQDLQNQQTELAINEINQEKEKTRKDYLKEQRGAYTDWQKQSNQYGANAEQMAANGLRNTGYSESSQVSMYNTYQNRVATARDSYNLAVQNYDNKIAEARLANNSKLAEIAYKALQTELELSLNGFQYKNTLLLDQINKQQTISDTYYARWQNVLNQMNTENALAEQIRQYNEQFEYKKERDKIADEQWQKEFDLAKKASSSSRRSSGGSSGGGGGAKVTTESPQNTQQTTEQVQAIKFNSYDDVYNWFKSKGYSDKDAKKQATEAWNKAVKNNNLNNTSNNKNTTNNNNNKNVNNNSKKTGSQYHTATMTPSLSTPGAKAAFNAIKGKTFANTSAIDKALKGYTVSQADKNKIYKAFGF